VAVNHTLNRIDLNRQMESLSKEHKRMFAISRNETTAPSYRAYCFIQEIYMRQRLNLYLLCCNQPDKYWQRLLSDDSISSEDLAPDSVALVLGLHEMLEALAIETETHAELVRINAQIATVAVKGYEELKERIATEVKKSQWFLDCLRCGIRSDPASPQEEEVELVYEI
jgi:hypothetical protein